MTLDARTLKNIGTLDAKARPVFARFAAAAKEVAAAQGCEYVMLCGNRSYAEQNALYAIGRSKPGTRVTNARGGYSNHNFGIAGDFGVFRDGQYLDESMPKVADAVHKAVASIAEAHGLSAGYYWDFQDAPHFEIETHLTLAQKRARMEQRGSVL